MISATALSIALVSGIAVLLGFLGVTCLRTGARALGLWMFAWTCLLAAGAIVLIGGSLPGIRPGATAATALMSPLMLAGALAHTERRVPGWLLPLGGALAGLELLARQVAPFGTKEAIALAVEPTLALVAAYVVLRPTPEGGRTSAREARVLAGAFVLYACAEAADEVLNFLQVSSWEIWGSWLVLGLPLLSIQCAHFIHRVGTRYAAEQHRSRAHEERLRILSEANDTFVAEYDEYGTITYASDNIEGMTGLEPEELVGRNARDFFDRYDDSPIRRALEERGRLTEADVLSASSAPQRSRRDDGEIIYYEATRATYRAADGSLRIVGQARNVTERILREGAIRESERRLRRGEQVGRFGSWEYVVADDALVWSDHLFRMHGLEPRPGPIDREEFGRVVEGGDVVGMWARASREKPGAPLRGFRYAIRRADTGERRIFQTRGEIERDDRGEVVRLVGATIDLTEVVELKEALAQGRSYLESFFEANIVGLFHVWVDSSIRQANDAFLEPLGYTREDLPLDWRSLTPETMRARDDQSVVELIENGVVLPFETELLARDGGRVPVLMAGARLDDEQSLVIALDQSERKRAEAWVAAEQSRLEETIAERTRELVASRHALVEAERLAAVGTLAAGVAHQINNPIGAILNGAEYALLCLADGDEDAPEILRETIERNLDEARRCARIVRSMLQFSRDESTAKWSEDLSSVVRRAHRAITAYARDRGAEVEVSTPAEPIHAVVNPIEIEQAIVNVLSNAIESREYGARIHLHLRRCDDRAEIEVADDGRGIAAKDREQLLDPFFTTRTHEGGTGLGLSVAHGVLADHGGEIRIDSRPGVGTRVVLSLPIDDKTEAQTSPIGSQPPSGGRPGTRPGARPGGSGIDRRADALRRSP